MEEKRELIGRKKKWEKSLEEELLPLEEKSSKEENLEALLKEGKWKRDGKEKPEKKVGVNRDNGVKNSSNSSDKNNSFGNRKGNGLEEKGVKKEENCQIEVKNPSKREENPKLENINKMEQDGNREQNTNRNKNRNKNWDWEQENKWKGENSDGDQNCKQSREEGSNLKSKTENRKEMEKSVKNGRSGKNGNKSSERFFENGNRSIENGKKKVKNGDSNRNNSLKNEEKECKTNGKLSQDKKGESKFLKGGKKSAKNGEESFSKGDKTSKISGKTAQNGESQPKTISKGQEKGAQTNPDKQKGNDKKGNGNKSFHWFKDLQRAVKENETIHRNRLTTHSRIKPNPNRWIKFTSLGGLEEIGGNCAVLESENSAIVIDCGMSFPKEDMHGVDILIPDFTYLKEIRNKIKGLIITHGHEDHIGAVPYLFKELQVPIYGTSFPLGMIRHKFREHKITQYQNYFRSVKKRHPIQIGDFKVEWIHMTHSIVDSSSLAIQTPVGTIIHTGDFKIDHTPIDGYPPDLHRLAHYGEQGVLALFSDSTNSHQSGITPSERIVGNTFRQIFQSTSGRIIMSTFSSNIHRVYQAILTAQQFGRKVAVIGRSMEQNLQLAMELGYIKFDKSIFIRPWEISKYPDNQILIITTGSQGESMSALYRMAKGEHRQKLKEGDQIIISAKAIPGNEPAVSKLINFLLKKGAQVAYQEFSEIHVSGHASQEEQKLMLRLVKPKYFFPVHGEFNHLVRHKLTAMETGIPEEHIFIMEDGEQWEIGSKGVRKVGKVKVGKVFIDNQLNEEIEKEIVESRQELAQKGIVLITLQIDRNRGEIIGKPRVVSYGIVSERENIPFGKEIEELLINFLEHNRQLFHRPRILENRLKDVIKKHIRRIKGLKKDKGEPIVVPIVNCN